MLAWIVYVMLVSTALSLAAFMLERTALLRIIESMATGKPDYDEIPPDEVASCEKKFLETKN